MKSWLVVLLVIAGCSKAKSGADAASDAGDDAALVDAPPVDAPPADTGPETGADAPPADAEVMDASSERTGFTSWTDCGWSGGLCVCDGLLACAAVAGGEFYGLGSVQARACTLDGDVCEYVRFQETEGGGVASRCRAHLAGASCSNDLLSTSDCVELFRCNLQMGNCPPDVFAPSVISCR